MIAWPVAALEDLRVPEIALSSEQTHLCCAEEAVQLTPVPRWRTVWTSSRAFFPAPSPTLSKDRTSGAERGSALGPAPPARPSPGGHRVCPSRPRPLLAETPREPNTVPGRRPRAHIPTPPLEAVSQTALHRGRRQASGAQPSPVSQGPVAPLDCGFEVGVGRSFRPLQP